MKIGIIGLPQTGKKTLFKLLTDISSSKELEAKRPLFSIVQLRDPRFDFLVDSYKPKKSQKARIEVALLAKIEKDSIAKGEIFKEIQDTDALVHVVRAFEDDSVYHIQGSVSPERDIKTINDELIMHDLIFLEKRLERLKENKSKGPADSLAKESMLISKLKEQLDKELPLRLLNLGPEEIKILSGLPLLSLKEMVVLLNISEKDLKEETFLKQLQDKFASEKLFFMQACLKIEAEIAELESPVEREAFIADLGISESALDHLTHCCLQALWLISFFTVVSDEVRQWTIKKGAGVVDAASFIHTDLGRGFIRAEVINFCDLKQLGSEEKVKRAGKLYIKGRDYIVQDGDIIKIRFNV